MIRTGITEGENIKTRYRNRRSTLKPYLSGLKSPIPATIKDAQEYEKFFKVYKDTFIPFAGTDSYSSHSLLGLLLSLRELSPTQRGILLSMKRFALSGRIDIIKREDETFDIGEDESASDQEKRQFKEFGQRVVWRDQSGRKVSPRDFGAWINDDLRTCGNYYIEITLVETMGERSVFVDLLRPEDCLYLVTPAGEDRVIGVSPIWTLDYIQRKPPRYVPTYPVFEETEPGVMKTIIHGRDGNFPWYGRPDSIASMNYQFFEFQNADYMNKVAYSQFAGQVMIEVEDEGAEHGFDDGAEDDGYENFVDQANHNFTNKADDLQTVLVTSRPFGARPAFVFQFTPNTNEGWYKTTNEEAERQILKSHGYPRRLVGLDAASGLSSNVFLDTLKVYSPTLFRSIQEGVERPINQVYRVAAEFLGDLVGQDLAVKFTSPYQRLLEEQENDENVIDDPND